MQEIQIASVRIHNFRSFRNAQLNTESDTTVLIGKNGCGKSNLLQAIRFAFSADAAPHTDRFLSDTSAQENHGTMWIDVKLTPIKPYFSAQWQSALRLTQKDTYFAFRTEFTYENGAFVNRKYRLNDWDAPENKQPLAEDFFEYFDVFFCDSEPDGEPASERTGLTRLRLIDRTRSEIVARCRKASRRHQPYLPILLVEEPELHIHPQAQRYAYAEIAAVAGQKIITTHSPYILSQIDLEKIRCVRKRSDETEVTAFLSDGLSQDDIRKIKRTVMATRGEILYANAVILGEGETEEQSLSVFSRTYFKKEPFEMGINIVGVGGSNYLPFMRILERLGIHWYIFSDGEPMPLNQLKNCLKRLYGEENWTGFAEHRNVIFLDQGMSIEQYFIANGYQNQIIKAINKTERNNGYPDGYFARFMKKNHGKFDKEVYTGKKCPTCKQEIVEGTRKDYQSEGGKDRALLDCMTSNGGKTRYAAAIAEEIAAMHSPKRIPPKMRELFESIEKDLELK